MRILFVAFMSSIHTARWISQLRDEKWDIHLFPVDEYYLHPDLREITVHTLFRHKSAWIDPSVQQKSLWWPFNRGRERLRRVSKRLSGDPIGAPARLARVISSLKPDIVHSLEMQNAGYLTLDSKRSLGNGSFPPWIYSSWGSDIYYYGQQPEHQARIRGTLASCNFLIADCHRDVSLATEWGFKGEVLGVFPVSGGYDLEWMKQFRQPRPVSSRRVIVVKGRHGDFGARALVALEALHECADLLSEYEIVVIMASEGIPGAVEYISQATGLRITVLPHNSSHEETLRLLGRARIALNAALSEGTPNFLLEAMTMGAFPIHSDTVSTAEWINDGQNGLVVPAEDPKAIAAAIRRAISDDQLVNQAAEINEQITASRIDRHKIQPQVVEIYKRVFAQEAQEKK